MAVIQPKDGKKYLDKLFLSKKAHKDFLCGAPTEVQIYIPIPTAEHPKPNVQLWLKNGAGKILLRFKDREELLALLEQIKQIVSSDAFLDEFQHAEDMSDYL